MVGVIIIIMTPRFTNGEDSNQVNDRREKGREREAGLLPSARPHSPRARSGLQAVCLEAWPKTATGSLKTPTRSRR